MALIVPFSGRVFLLQDHIFFSDLRANGVPGAVWATGDQRFYLEIVTVKRNH